jgi:hypothetical protein
MENLLEKKQEIENLINNSTWESLEYGLIYKFQNQKDLWINGNAHFIYEISIENDRLMLNFYPNGEKFLIELNFGEMLYLQNEKYQFELSPKE